MTRHKLVSGIVLLIVLGIIIVGGMQIWTRQNMQGILEVHHWPENTPVIVHEIPLSDTNQIKVFVLAHTESALVEIVDENAEVVTRGETGDRRNPLQVTMDSLFGSGLKYSVELTSTTNENAVWLVKITPPDSRIFRYDLQVSATSTTILETRVSKIREANFEYYYQVEAWLRKGSEIICDAEITTEINVTPGRPETNTPIPLQKMENCHFIGQVGPVGARTTGFSVIANHGLVRRQTFFPK
jgi:hypothetical protein